MERRGVNRWTPRIRTLGLRGSDFFLVALVALVAAVLLLQLHGGWRFDAVMSGSMEPAIPVGAVVALKPVEPNDVEVGDVVAYRTGESLVTHRVIEVQREPGQTLFTTKGDATEDPDLEPVPSSRVVGEVVFDVPYAGFVTVFMQKKLGFLLAILLPGLAVIALELRNVWRVVARRQELAGSQHNYRANEAPTALDSSRRVAEVTAHDGGEASVHRPPIVERTARGVFVGVPVCTVIIVALILLEPL